MFRNRNVNIKLRAGGNNMSKQAKLVVAGARKVEIYAIGGASMD